MKSKKIISMEEIEKHGAQIAIIPFFDITMLYGVYIICNGFQAKILETSDPIKAINTAQAFTIKYSKKNQSAILEVDQLESNIKSFQEKVKEFDEKIKNITLIPTQKKLEVKNLKELRKMAKEMKMKRYSSFTKDVLIEKIISTSIENLMEGEDDEQNKVYQ